MIHREFRFKSNKTKLYGQYWTPTTPKAVIVLIHSLGEHSTKYRKYVAKPLTKEGFAVLSFDLFGHGKSKGKRGVAPNYEIFLDTLEIVLQKSKKIFPFLAFFYIWS